MNGSNRGQVSLEYLLVLSVSISVLLFILPVVSRVQSVSEEVVKKSYLENLAWDISNSCSRLSAVGTPSSLTLRTSYPIYINLEGNKVNLSLKDSSLNSYSDWNNLCDLSEGSFSRNETITVTFPKSH